MRIAFLGNFTVPYSSETHHALTLEQLGHTVVRLQETRATALQIETEALHTDLFVWVHTHGWRTPGDIATTLQRLRAAGVVSLSYHLDRWMGLARQQEMQPDQPYWQLDHFFTVDQVQADWLTENTSMQGHYLPPGVYGTECYMAMPRTRFDVAFVGSKGYHPEYPYRPKLIEWLTDTYGDRFRHYGGGGNWPTVRGADLNGVYADAKVVVGDSLILDPQYEGKYWSDRVPETLGRGGFLIHPWVHGIDESFHDMRHLALYRHGDLEQLKTLIDYFLRNEAQREEIRRAGYQHALSNHTYKNRWNHILEAIA
ncbi:glycosyltransferase [Nocardia sp. N2S4-5]|uniref:glycosyltransferase family protein n=1 Tax=Nocardia sp. N2S4-5 TaxID=3351565 RepID=UPI0037D6DB9B